MKKGFLSNYFKGIAVKRLSEVETNPTISNQHEFNGVAQLKQMLGNEKQTFPARFIYLGKYEDDVSTCDGFLTWYDARKNHPKRSEYRLYYPTNPVSVKAEPDDLLVIGQRPDDSMLVIVARQNTTFENNITWLFNLSDEQMGRFLIRQIHDEQDVKLGFASHLILEELGIQIVETSEDYLELILARFKNGFPTTREFSAFARETANDVSTIEAPDDAFITWIEHEEMLFRTLERHLVKERIETGFVINNDVDVDGFIKFSLSVQNRRKARVGYALENHLEQIFIDHKVDYSRGAKTENKAKPDFIFPNIHAYHTLDFPINKLTMLGVKSSCKDRWRQVLSEAKRIDNKHLFTLEPGISVNQTDEMQAQKLQLVLPWQLHDTYKPEQRSWLITLESFMGLVKYRQTV